MASALLRSGVFESSKQQRSRPRSWFSFPRTSTRRGPARTLSVQLPKDTSSSSVSRSVISAPVLTGTTNIDLAELEGVCVRDLVDAGLSVPKGEEERSYSSLKGRLFRLPKRMKSTKDKSRGCLPDITTRPDDSASHTEDTWRLSTANKGIARRRAETINLCRGKINKLTGNGNVKRKSINKCEGTLFAGNEDMIAQQQPQTFTRIYTKTQSSTITTEHKLLSFNQSTHDLAFGSLTRSFVSAIDKLDFYAPPTPPIPANMAFVKSKSSIFSLKKRHRPTEAAEYPKTASATFNKAVQEMSRSSAVEEAMKTDTTKKSQSATQRHDLAGTGAPSEPMQFSEAANAYVPAELASTYPKGVRVLGMHSNTMEFATAPPGVTDLPKPPRHTPTVEEVTPVNDDDEDEDPVIEDAPIYSPSLGDLSQYARPTPPSARVVQVVDRDPVPETPTQVQADKSFRRRLGLRKSKSGLGLLNIFNRSNKEDKVQKSPLRAKDSNRPLTQAPHLKKCRSMNLTGLLRRSETATSGIQDTGPVSNQPIKPSPLRHEALDEEAQMIHSEPYEAQKRTPPRNNMTPRDSAKRMGIIGLPKDNVDGRMARM